MAGDMVDKLLAFILHNVIVASGLTDAGKNVVSFDDPGMTQTRPITCSFPPSLSH